MSEAFKQFTMICQKHSKSPQTIAILYKVYELSAQFTKEDKKQIAEDYSQFKQLDSISCFIDISRQVLHLPGISAQLRDHISNNDIGFLDIYKEIGIVTENPEVIRLLSMIEGKDIHSIAAEFIEYFHKIKHLLLFLFLIFKIGSKH